MSPKTTVEVTPQEWYNNLVFSNNHFAVQLVRRLAHTPSKAADIGECFSTARSISDGDAQEWNRMWLSVANRLLQEAHNFEKKKHLISAGETLMRATNYILASEFYLVEQKDRERRLDIWQKARDAFIKALTFLYPDGSVKPVRIPYQKTTLPGYFCRTHKKNAPLLITHTGFDATAEEVFWGTGIHAMRRGYNCLIFEGPGQGEMIVKQNMPFRFDWEIPVKAVVDFAMLLPDVNQEKIALMGTSFGGYFAPRAAAFEKRIKACIANGGVFDISNVFYAHFPKELLQLITDDPDQFNAIMANVMTGSIQAHWAFNNGVWRFAAKSIADFMKAIKQYSLENVAKNIICPTLIVDSEAEGAGFKGQAQLLYDALECPKTFLLFTREEAAQAHCQMGANLISTAKIFNWLDETLI